jgi:hypothetical protein
MGLSRFTPGCCCGSDLCTVFSDNFDRDAVGANWTVRSGTWSIPGSESAVQTASANAELDQSSGGLAGKASAQVGSTASGDQLQVGLGAAGTFVAAELEVGSGVFRIVSISGGGRTVLRECSVAAGTGDSLEISLCSDTYPYGEVSARLFTASFQSSPLLTWGDAIGPCETFAGVLATGALSGLASFSSFTLSNVQCDDDTCPSCSQCCWPPGGGLPSQVQVDISGLGPAATSVGVTPCTDSQCAAINGTYILEPTSGCTASYTSCPDMPCCACYELTDLNLACDSVGDEPITTIRFMAFNSDGGFCQGPGQCNLYVELSIASGFVVFHFDLALGSPPDGYYLSQACGTYDPGGGCDTATLIANTYATGSEPGGLRCQHDTLDDPTSATAVVTPL